MNSSILSGKWKEIKGEIQKTWGELTSDELDRTQGNATSLIGLIEQKFGVAKDEAAKKINELLGRYQGASPSAANPSSVGRYDSAGADTRSVGDSLSDKLNSTIDSAKEGVRDTEVKRDEFH